MAYQQGQREQQHEEEEPEEPHLARFPCGEDRMRLTDGEREVAKLIKAAVLDIPEVEPLSDFMYAQYAIVAVRQEDISATGILERIQNLQHFKEENRVLDTMEDGQRLISRNVHDLIPGYHLSYGYSCEEGAYMQTVDMTRFNSSILANPERARAWMAGEYYFRHAAFSDFESVRRGLVQLVECQGYEWKNPNMLNITAMRKMASEFGAHYPMHFFAFKFYHTGMFVNLAVSTAKRLVPSKIHKNFEVGCKFDYGRLDELSLLPTPEKAMRRLVAGFHKCLKTRYQNEAAFSLDGA